ncbi:alpha/beta hydrolase [Pseudosulfitobacter sp. DSM 107133]|uniref:alpha/beta fold hydrolase n=1 Tax=Pseudosulfitobacter sp. DSM 107133 TaxID=2883100 RepID=UPI000DF32816|nr:alpha/beta hydrolase [Pseudosulfitobacter sp. DSM 107133]UOA27981.1 Haloacetate dehalogenase H-1 [Pseudosulfitobacter sp. DSM 107133]
MATFTTSDGLSLYYTDTGNGLPILCLSGLGRTGADFRYVAPYLEEYRVITMDYRGRGQSEFDKNWRNYTLAIESRDAVELLDHLGIDKAAILGTSRGGLNAMMLGQMVPNRILGVAFNDVGPEIDPEGIKDIMAYLGVKPSIRTHAEAALILPNLLGGFIGVPASRWMEEAETHFVDDGAGGLNLTYDAHLRDAVANETESPDFWAFFDDLVGKPLCLIHAAGSDILNERTAQEMRARRPDMIYANLPDRGHIPFLDEPAAVTALKDWLDLIQ